MRAFPGVRVTFDPAREALLARQWADERVSPWLRALVLITGLFYVEQGAQRLRIQKLLGNSEAEISRRGDVHAYGLAADLSIIELVDHRASHRSAFVTGRESPKVRWVEERLNLLLPFSDGAKRTATYHVDQGHLHVEVPYRGFAAEAAPLAAWNEVGVNGSLEEPRRLRA